MGIARGARPTASEKHKVGSSLDEILEVLGLEANEVYVQVDNMDCFNTAVLTR